MRKYQNNFQVRSTHQRKVRQAVSRDATTSPRGRTQQILQLQRTLGNRAVGQFLQSKRLTPQGRLVGVQPKLMVGAAGDQYEQEADRAARQVMNTPDAVAANSMQRAMSPEEDKDQPLQTKPLATSTTPFMQRQLVNNEESEDKEKPVQAKVLTAASREPLQRQPETEEEETKSIQGKSAGSMSDGFEGGDDVESRISQSKGRGSPLPGPVRAYMEPRFGVDFSHVRVHTGSEAIQMNRDVGAQAFTHGSDIYFGKGHSPTNSELTAHELTHVIQQTGSPPLQTKNREGEVAPSIQRSCPACAADDSEEKGSNPMSHAISGNVLKRKADEPPRSVVQAEQRVGKAGTSIQRRIGDGHDLASSRFSGDPVLEACFDNERLLRFGARGDAVQKLQQALVDAGFPLPKFGVDGTFGSETQTAVRNFQQASTITVDGLVGPETMGALDARFSGPTPPGPTPPGPTPPGPTPPGPTPPAPAPESITSQTVATSPGARTRTTIGVGEEVNLTHAPGSAAWTTTIGPTPLSATNGITVILTAPDTAQRITVTAGTATLSFDVIAPTSIAMDREPGTGVKHTLNQPDSGIQTRVFLGPDTVNFNKVIYHEMDVAGVPTNPGVYSCNTFSTGHCGAGGGGVACPDKAVSSTVVAGKGTQSVLGDCAYSGHCGTAPPFVPGSISINIPYEYKVGAGAFHAITNVAQVHALAADASTLTSSKAGATGSTTVAAAAVIIPQCP